MSAAGQTAGTGLGARVIGPSALAGGFKRFATLAWTMAVLEFKLKFFGSILGRLILFGYSWALLHHMAGGVRHLIWDTGRGLSKETSTKLALATLGFSLVTTSILWIVVIIL